MKRIFTTTTLLLMLMTYQVTNAEFCYPDGCVEYSNPWGSYPTSNYTSAVTLINELKAGLDKYHGAGGYGISKDDTGQIVGLSCGNGVNLTYKSSLCKNLAVNAPTCNQCAAGATMTNNKCLCANGATGSSCNICPAGQVMQNNLCVCSNGATNPTACSICPSGSNMVSGQCTCNNNADVFQQCNSCKTGQAFDNNSQCKDGCSTTNACGQTITGFMNNGKCELSTINGADPNASCIVDFNVTTNTVNPNGSVEFSWSLANLPSNVKSRCGFVDLTTPTPRPIPGLQNLDPGTDRIRINNVQATTRFCLVCQFYNLLNSNSLLGEAARHSWVRVIRVGEN
jgi:hypothetical protein